MGGQCDALVVLTGIGTKILIEALLTRWAREEVLEALEKTCIIARSGKPLATLKKYKLKAQYIAEEPNTWKELLEEVDAHYPVSQFISLLNSLGLKYLESSGYRAQARAQARRICARCKSTSKRVSAPDLCRYCRQQMYHQMHPRIRLVKKPLLLI